MRTERTYGLTDRRSEATAHIATYICQLEPELALTSITGKQYITYLTSTDFRHCFPATSTFIVTEQERERTNESINITNLSTISTLSPG